MFLLSKIGKCHNYKGVTALNDGPQGFGEAGEKGYLFSEHL